MYSFCMVPPFLIGYGRYTLDTVSHKIVKAVHRCAVQECAKVRFKTSEVRNGKSTGISEVLEFGSL